MIYHHAMDNSSSGRNNREKLQVPDPTVYTRNVVLARFSGSKRIKQ